MPMHSTRPLGYARTSWKMSQTTIFTISVPFEYALRCSIFSSECFFMDDDVQRAHVFALASVESILSRTVLHSTRHTSAIMPTPIASANSSFALWTACTNAQPKRSQWSATLPLYRATARNTHRACVCRAHRARLQERRHHGHTCDVDESAGSHQTDPLRRLLME